MRGLDEQEIYMLSARVQSVYCISATTTECHTWYFRLHCFQTFECTAGCWLLQLQFIKVLKTDNKLIYLFIYNKLI